MKHALAPKAAAAGDPMAVVVVGLVEGVDEVEVDDVDTKLLVSCEL